MTNWTTWQPPGAPFPFASSIHSRDFMLITEGGHDPDTGDIPDSVSEQTQHAITKIRARLEAGGFSLSDIIAIRPYVTAREHAPEFDRVFAAALPDPKPYTGALLIVQLIDPRMKIEVEVIAHRAAHLS